MNRYEPDKPTHLHRAAFVLLSLAALIVCDSGQAGSAGADEAELPPAEAVEVTEQEDLPPADAVEEAGEEDLPSIEPAEEAGEEDCGWTPATVYPPMPFHWSNPSGAGCGVLPVDDDVSIVREVRIVEIALQQDDTLVRYVLLDESGRRVVFRHNQQIRHEVRLEQTQRGITNILQQNQNNGVYELRVAPDERPEPCELHVILRFDNGTGDLEHWVDDWMYDC